MALHDVVSWIVDGVGAFSKVWPLSLYQPGLGIWASLVSLS